MDVDQALAVVGGMRRYHLAQFIALGLSSFMPLAGIAMMFVFIAWTPPHHCTVPDNTLVNETIPVDPSSWDQKWSKCSMYVNSSISNDTTSCQNGWTYYTEGEKTIVMEWDLVCEYNYLAELSETLSMLGALIAEMTVAFAVDKFGRRYIHLIGIVLIIIFGTCLATAPNYIVFLIFRPFAAFSLTGLLIPGATLLLELFDSNYRTFAGVGMEFLWSFSYMYLALLGYLVQDWRKLVLILALTNIAFLFHFWTLPESVWWLTANDRFDEAEEVLQKMAKYNGVKVKGRLLRKSSKESVKKQNSIGERLAIEKSEFTSAPLIAGKKDPNDIYMEKFTDLFTHRILLKHTIISSFMWFACELVYYGLILTTPSLAGNRYLNFFLSGLVEIPAYMLVYIIVRHGRRIPVTVSFVLSGVCLIAVTLVPKTTASGASLQPLIITLSLLGKFFITASFSIVLMYSRELFPTNLRGTASGVCNILGRTGSMGAPFMAYAAKSIPWIPNVTLGSVAIIVGFICLCLPETCNKPLPQKLDDIDRLFGKQTLEVEVTKSSSEMNGQSEKLNGQQLC